MKWYYHALYMDEIDLPRNEDGDVLRDQRAVRNFEIYRDEKQKYGGELLFTGQDRLGRNTTEKPLFRVQNGDVLTIDSHGGPPGTPAENRIGVEDPTRKFGPRKGYRTITTRALAARLKRDGLKNRQILIRLLACHGADALTRRPDETIGSKLAKALGLSNVVVEAYEGEVKPVGATPKLAGPGTGKNPKENAAYHFRHYYDYRGNDIDRALASVITGIPVGQKQR